MVRSTRSSSDFSYNNTRTAASTAELGLAPGVKPHIGFGVKYVHINLSRLVNSQILNALSRRRRQGVEYRLWHLECLTERSQLTMPAHVVDSGRVKCRCFPLHLLRGFMSFWLSPKWPSIVKPGGTTTFSIGH